MFTITETFTIRYCEGCCHTTRHSVLAGTAGAVALPAVAECTECRYVAE